MFFAIDGEFWTDPDVVDDFTPEDRYFYLYLLTSPHGNIAGCYSVSFKQIGREMGYSEEAIEHLVDRFINFHRLIDYDSENKEILIHKWGKHHWTKSEKYIVALKKKIGEIKTAKFKRYLVDLLVWYENDSNKDMVWIPYQYDIDTSFLSFPYYYPINNNILNGEEIKEAEDKKKIVSCQEIADLFNEICNSFSRVTRLSENRKTAIKARLKTYTYDDFVELFKKAEDSKFLKGANDRNWSATFDWLIKDSNMAKVLDGNYDNRGGECSNGRNSGSVRSGGKKVWNIRADVE